MYRLALCLFAGIVVLTLAVIPLAAADDLKSGPQPGTLLPGPFHPLNLTRTWASKYHCLVCEHGLNPVVAIFAREPGDANQPLTQLLKRLDDAVSRHQKGQLGGFVVFLNEDFAKEDRRGSLVQRLENLANGIKLQQVTLAVDGAAGPSGYQINPEADVTVVLYVQHKVVANYAFRKGGLSEKDVETILAEVEKLVPAKKK
jgi:hypothetical protein